MKPLIGHHIARLAPVTTRTHGAICPRPREDRSGGAVTGCRRRAGTLSRSEGARWRARDAPLVAHCHLGLGRLSIRTGDREEALRHLAVATSMCREMDMRFWLEQAEGDAKGLV
jgi:hypothetical protein